ncbi:hypothetical protein KIW84_034620 [Lathyrus oleraceus]|uniref:Uncharacterized protein n=1 Tax=Pisum sativum TaxID=3888 RepID=A0A9D4XZX5_PEA|nr:hypothetical protein KIW84_034620 [Pisum sativum]
MTKPNTLVARIFKARYFPTSSFFYANLGNNPSFVWRSLWKSCCFLDLGCRWMNDDDSRIKVISDPWLRGVGKGWVNAPQNRDAYNISVNELMLNGVKMWDEYKIRHLFTRDIVMAILVVPFVEGGLSSVIEPGMHNFIDTKEAFYSWNDRYLAQNFQEDIEIDQSQDYWEPPIQGWVKSEARAVKEAIQKVTYLQMDWVIFESDLQMMVQAIYSDKDGNFVFSVILLDIKNLLVCNPVGDFSITHDFSSNEIYSRPMQLCVKAWKRVRSSAECTLVEPTCN